MGFLPKMNKLLWRESIQCTLFAFIILGILSLIAVNLSFFKPFNNAFKDFSYLDLYYAEKLHENQGVVNQNIILVNVNRLNRKEIAYLLDKVKNQAPKVIGLDVIFKEDKDSLGDTALAKSHTIDNLVTTYAVTDRGIAKSTNQITSINQLCGYSNFGFDTENSVIRNFQGYRKNKDSIEVSFGAAVAKMYLDDKWNVDLEEYLQKKRPINFKGNRDNFLVLEYEDILGENSIPILKDKIVLLGYLGDFQNHKYDIEDKHFTPMNEKFVGKSAPDTFGLVVHANIINMIITDDFISVVPNWFLVVLTILVTYLALTYFIWLGKKGLVSYSTRLKLIRLAFIVLTIWISLILFRYGIFFKTAGILAVTFFSISLLGYYKKIAHLLYKKFKWNGYFFQD